MDFRGKVHAILRIVQRDAGRIDASAAGAWPPVVDHGEQIIRITMAPSNSMTS